MKSQAAFCFIPYAWQTDLDPVFRIPDSESRNSSIPPGSGPREEKHDQRDSCNALDKLQRGGPFL